MQKLVCAECKCSLETCSGVIFKCKNCIKKSCCCILVHTNKLNLQKNFNFLQQISQNIKRIFIAALGLEILCIISAELGENVGLYIFGFNLQGILIAYVLGFTIAGFSTFMTILGRYDFDFDYKRGQTQEIGGCCSFLEENSNKGFIFNLISTFLNFNKGFTKIIIHRRNPQMKYILKTSMIVLITAESACILTAETVTLLFYQYSIFLAIPLALLIGTFTLTIVETFRKIKNKNKELDCSRENPRSQFLPLSDFKGLKRGS